MKKRFRKELTNLPPLLVIAGALSSWHIQVAAQEQGAEPESAAAAPQSVSGDQKPEEVVVVGRAIGASESLVQERLEDASVVDTIGAEAISRLGDSTVAASLRRVPGLSLVSDKFVYIRGLGERYSATSLNGSDIPSPDLTRNVIPLDIFPTSVVESIRVQKAWSPDLSANFGGGSVNIRSKGIPDRFEMNFEVSSGTNTENSGKALSYPGGGDDSLGEDDGTRALSPAILAALNEYQGDISTQNILTFIRRANDGVGTLADAQAVNRALALQLNRNLRLQEESIDPDLGVKANVGNRFLVGDNWELGFLVGGTYDNGWRESEKISRNFSFPDQRTDTERESTYSVNISGTGNLGVSYLDEHEISTTSLYVRNTDDETAIRDFFNENREIRDGTGFRNYRFKYEQRSLTTHQIQGSHTLGDGTRTRFPLLDTVFSALRVPDRVNVTWFYSESKATTDIPNEATFSYDTTNDPTTADVLSESVAQQSNAADYRFTDLEDRVRDQGWAITWPLEFGNSKIDIKGGARSSQKARQYRQRQFGLGPLTSNLAARTGPLEQVFSDDSIVDPANNFVFARQGTNNQSYLAATMTDSVFGIVDWSYDAWRLSTGARWEDYKQVAVDWNPEGYSLTNPQVTTDIDALRRGTFQSDEWYPAASLTYTTSWLAETFQLRLGWSETVVRPDLREITDASYIDPVTDILTRGNPGVVPADVTNYDLRAEWRFSSGDSLSVTLFNKELDNPIEFFESAASDTTIAREIVNAESGEVRGVELEGLKTLDFLGDFWGNLFLQGNVTVQDSELVAGPRADAPTNPERKMAGASDYVANVTLGFDSPDGKHTTSLIYNVFGERLFTAGRNGAPDAFEQPFHSVDVTYSWYPTDSLTIKAKAQNVLDGTIEIEREGVLTFEERPGTTLSLSASWKF